MQESPKTSWLIPPKSWLDPSKAKVESPRTPRFTFHGPYEEAPSKMSLDLACIGNCAYSALVDKRGQIVWSCYPRFDGDPIFCSLLKLSNAYSNDIGFFDVWIPHCKRSEQFYIKNTAVLTTKLYEYDTNSALEIVDFIPRFEQHEREYRPNMLIRILKPLAGRPRAKIRLRPTFGYGWGTPEKTRGSNHIRYLLSNMTVRLTTNAPISYVLDEVLFEVDEPIYLILMPDESLKAPIHQIAETYLHKTTQWWMYWTRNLSIPYEWQEEVIRAAVTLKMSNFEETGAIVAAMTTSIPNTPGGGNYDYRYCWLRDATLVVHALNSIGATGTKESFLRFLSNIVANFHASKQQSKLSSVYGISMETRLNEREMHRLPGYRGIGPVKLGVRETENLNNDVYGSAILALTQLFFDSRLLMQGDEVLFKKMEEMGEESAAIYNKPDLGTRGKDVKIHSYSSVMCWAVCDRLGKIAVQLCLAEQAKYWAEKAKSIKEDIMKHVWNENLNSFVSTWDGDDVNPLLLSFAELGFVDYKDPKFLGTMDKIEKTLLKHDMIFYPNESVANNYATFSYIKCLAMIGKADVARKLFEKMLASLGTHGLLSENMNPETKEMWGNFPQNVALVGLISCAITLSKPWETAF